MTTTSLSWYRTPLCRCLASTLGWTPCSCRLSRFSSVTLFCWRDGGGSAAAAGGAFCRWTFCARSTALSRGLSPAWEPAAGLAAVACPRPRGGAAAGHLRQFVGGLPGEKATERPCLKSLRAILLQLFIRRHRQSLEDTCRFRVSDFRSAPFTIKAIKAYALFSVHLK